MQRRSVLWIAGMAALAVGASSRANAQLPYRTYDWVTHRGNPQRTGYNGGDSRPVNNLDPNYNSIFKVERYRYPYTVDLGPEMVVENGPDGGAPPTGRPVQYTRVVGGVNQQSFSLSPAPSGAGTVPIPDTDTWKYPYNTSTNPQTRGIGAWPPFATQVQPDQPDKAGDYLFAFAQNNADLQALANLNLDAQSKGDTGQAELQLMPNVSGFLENPLPVAPFRGRNFYHVVDDALKAPGVAFARWSFGTNYPAGTRQGLRDTSNAPLQQGQRYAVYIRYPGSSTLFTNPSTGNPDELPNTDFVFVRVSWGQDPNDNRFSRIFCIGYGDTGGFWKRVRSSAGEDRYFPYIGYPIQVTVYNTGFTATNDIGVPTIVPVDAVRLVPEAGRGDIHAPAASAAYPPGSDPYTTAGAVQLTFFGRDETTGPQAPANLVEAQASVIGKFTTIPFNPALPPTVKSGAGATNPPIDDPSSSKRAAVFYCLQDDFQNNKYAKVRWRYVARSTVVPTTTVDDDAPAPTFVLAPGAIWQTEPGAPVPGTPGPDDCFGDRYHYAKLTANGSPLDVATWTTSLSTSVTGGTYSVFVWIPASNDNPSLANDPRNDTKHRFATSAHYQVTTSTGVSDYYLDQRNSIVDQGIAAGTKNPGTWRRLASGIRFPVTSVPGAGTEVVQAVVSVLNDGPETDKIPGNTAAGDGGERVLVADAVQFVPDSITSNSVVAAPLVAQVTWPSGTPRQVVYFATTDGHVWCLDAIGALDGTGNHVGSLTTAYWVYPSISDPTFKDPDYGGLTTVKDPTVGFSGEPDDPNFNADSFNSKPNVGIDGQAIKTHLPGPPATDVWSIEPTSRAPQLGPFTASPQLITSVRGAGNVQVLLVPNTNGRLYGLDPAGRVTPSATMGGYPANEPFPQTISKAPDNPGVPGTTRRIMTWPTLGRDKWIVGGAVGFPNNPNMKPYPDDAAKTYFRATATVPIDIATGNSDRAILGGGDGHVYAVDLQSFQPNTRISNPTNKGAPRWTYPAAKIALGPITQPVVLTDNNHVIFTALDTNSSGSRVYMIENPNTAANGTANARWIYPGTSTPGAAPLATDKLGVETPFTAPVWKLSVSAAVNAGNEVCYIANTDGRIFAIDSTMTGGGEPALVQEWAFGDPLNPGGGAVPGQPNISVGTTRASLTFINRLKPLQRYRFSANTGNAPGGPPALLLTLDTGVAWGFNAVNGRRIWRDAGANIGNVPLDDPAGGATPVYVPTSNAWRGADMITSSDWMYQGDEGNQDAGEVNGQLHAYSDFLNNGSQGSGETSPDEPTVNPDSTALDIRLVDLWNGAKDSPPGPWDNFGLQPPANPISPYDAYQANQQKPNTVNNPIHLVVYEWGDQVKVAAWGAFYYDPATPGINRLYPQVSFRLYSGTQQREQIVTAILDAPYDPNSAAYKGGPPPAPNHNEIIPGDPNVPAIRYWVAKTIFQFGRASDVDAQTPGKRYTVYAEARINTPGGDLYSETLQAGQFDRFPYDGTHGPEDLPPGRLMSLAHPLSVSTRGAPGNTAVGANMLNIMGWTTNYPADNLNSDVTEILAQGNFLLDLSTFTLKDERDINAPLGFVPHGTSRLYQGVDPSGRAGQALYIADRSNLWKLNQPMNNVRVERTEMKWGWDPNNGAQAATGNVMNPLPWEQFPITTPNVSPDYPDIDRSHVALRGNGIDMAVRSVTLPLPDTRSQPGIKKLSPLAIDLQVDVPKYQPANVNTAYYDIRGRAFGTASIGQGLIAPLVVDNSNLANGGKNVVQYGNPALRALQEASGGYYGSYYIYIDSNGNGRFESKGAPGATPQMVASGREEVYRQINAGVAVQPDLNMRTEEETEDLGQVPHGMGYHPTLPYAPSYIGPYANAVGPFDAAGAPQFFLPYTVKNQGNVNLWNLRVAKVVGDYNTNPQDPAFWTKMTSDQVELNPVALAGQIWGVPFSFVNNGVGNKGLVSSLDHGNSNGFSTNWDNQYWPFAVPNSVSTPQDYVVAGNVLGWPANSRVRPSLHKPLPGDPNPTVLTIPDVAHGDPLDLLPGLAAFDTANGRTPRDTRPRIGVGVPLGTPAGTYSVPVYTFEDYTPDQWRAWMWYYAGGAGLPPTKGNDDAVWSMPLGPQDQNVVREAGTEPTFRLKLTVVENRITNGVTPGSYFQLDRRPVGNPAFGANIGPTAMRDRASGAIFMYYASNRQNNGLPMTPLANGQLPDLPWYLNYSQLVAVNNNAAPVGFKYDWRFEPLSGNSLSWWVPLAANTQYPAPPYVGQTSYLFPSAPADQQGSQSPLIPGVLNPATERHASPEMTQDDDPAKGTPATWLFWQGSVYKTGSGTGESFTLDTRTFYVQLQNGQPVAGIPFSFLNDPVLPKFGPRPIVFTEQGAGAGVGGARTPAFLFWYGGAQGQTRLYYNANVRNLQQVSQWSRDQALATPGNLQWQSNPVPVHRVVYTTYFKPAGELLDVIDLVYTGVTSSRKQPETYMTRYALVYPRDGSGNITGAPTGGLVVVPMNTVDNELLVRQGSTQTFQARDVAWQFRDAVTQNFVDNNGKPPYDVRIIRQDGSVVYPLLLNQPSYDNATGRIYWDSALGGQVIVDPQAGTVSFNGVGPRATDRVVVMYVPQSERLNITRNDSGAAIYAPHANALFTDTGGFTFPAAAVSNPGYALRGHVQASGANSGPIAFIDRVANPRTINIMQTNGNPWPDNTPGPPIARMWLLYRKTNANVTAPAALYYKTMRLMVRLPAGVKRALDSKNRLSPQGFVTITGNRGPVEIDWVRGRLYFTELDEGNLVRVAFSYAGPNGVATPGPTADYRVNWGDEISTAIQPGDQTVNETLLPTSATVNEGQISAFRDPFEEKVWVFWSSSRQGTSDIYYLPVSPQFYPNAAF